MTENAFFSDVTLAGLEKAASFTEERHKLIVSNIANVDTPFYKTQDLSLKDFQKELACAISNAQKESSASSKALMKLDTSDAFKVVRMGLDTGQLRHDQNNVSIEKEMSKLSKNAMMHNMFTSLLHKKYSLYETAIRGTLS